MWLGRPIDTWFKAVNHAALTWPFRTVTDYSCVFKVCVHKTSGLAAFANGEALGNKTDRASAFQELTV